METSIIIITIISITSIIVLNATNKNKKFKSKGISSLANNIKSEIIRHPETIKFLNKKERKIVKKIKNQI